MDVCTVSTARLKDEEATCYARRTGHACYSYYLVGRLRENPFPQVQPVARENLMFDWKPFASERGVLKHVPCYQSDPVPESHE